MENTLQYSMEEKEERWQWSGYGHLMCDEEKVKCGCAYVLIWVYGVDV